MASTSLTLLVGALILIIVYLINKYTYWKRRGIPIVKGLIPPFGHLLPVISMKSSVSELNRKIYEDIKNASMVGFYQMTSPALMVREPQLAKIVLQTSFPKFNENAIKINPEADPLLSHHPIFNSGEKWSAGRKRLTYAFSNVRLKILFATVKGVCKKFEDFMERRLKSSDKYETELKTFFAKFTGEVVTNAGLGIEGFCFDDESHPGSFEEIFIRTFKPSLRMAIFSSLIFFAPKLNKILKVGFVPKMVDTFMHHVVAENLEARRKSSVPRNDFLQLMVDFEKTEGGTIDQEVITAIALSFFIDGYETSSTTLTFVGYQLAAHQDVQQRVREEVTSTIAKYDGSITFDALKELTYLDRVINESQRMYPALGFLSKVCTEETELRGSDGLYCRVEPGTPIVISSHGLQKDPQYWTDPEVFDPERFNETRKHGIEKMTFLPFSDGPRVCVGQRMAILQMKACLATLLKNYKLELSPKTQLPLKLSPDYVLASVVGGLWVNIRKLE